MKLGIMCSGNGTNFENIVRTCNQDEVVFMIHNKEKCGAAKRAAKFGIPHCYVSHKNEEDMVKLFRAWRVDLIILAGYMRIGCTVHYVNEELDAGEIILQKQVPILPTDDVQSLTKAVQRMEYAIVPAAIEIFKNESLEKL